MDGLTANVPVLEAIGAKCGSLKVLSLGECYAVDDSAVSKVVLAWISPLPRSPRLAPIWRACSSLGTTREILGVSSSDFCGIKDASLVAISNNCKNLARLELEECYEITDVGVIAVATQCKKLARFSLPFR